MTELAETVAAPVVSPLQSTLVIAPVEIAVSQVSSHFTENDLVNSHSYESVMVTE